MTYDISIQGKGLSEAKCMKHKELPTTFNLVNTDTEAVEASQLLTATSAACRNQVFRDYGDPLRWNLPYDNRGQCPDIEPLVG